MSSQILVNILSFYGCFLITCGIISVIFIGMKAKTALISGGSSGFLAIVVAFLISRGIKEAEIAGFVLPMVLLIVFSWRSTKTLFRLLEMVTISHGDINQKAIAFLIISLMAIVSLVVLMFQFVFWGI